MPLKKLHICLAVSSLAFLTSCDNTAQISDPIVQKPEYSEADEALYMERFNSRGAAQVTGLSRYDPLANVSGIRNFESLPKTTEPTITANALKSANDYVSNMNSSLQFFNIVGALCKTLSFTDAIVTLTTS